MLECDNAMIRKCINAIMQELEKMNAKLNFGPMTNDK